MDAGDSVHRLHLDDDALLDDEIGPEGVFGVDAVIGDPDQALTFRSEARRRSSHVRTASYSDSRRRGPNARCACMATSMTVPVISSISMHDTSHDAIGVEQ